MAQYESFILRIWQTNGTHGTQWAAKLQRLPDGENLRFTEVDTLIDHLCIVLAPATTPADPRMPPANVIRFSREGGCLAEEQRSDGPEE